MTRLALRFGLLPVAALFATFAVARAADSVTGYPPAAEVKTAFLKMLDRPRVPLDPEKQKTETLASGFVAEYLTIASERKADGSLERVPILLVRPAKPVGRLPAVIALHGTGGNKGQLRGLLVEFARRGMIGVAIDARYHGERSGGARALKHTWRRSHALGRRRPVSRRNIRSITTPAGTSGGRSIICKRGPTSTASGWA